MTGEAVKLSTNAPRPPLSLALNMAEFVAIYELSGSLQGPLFSYDMAFQYIYSRYTHYPPR